MNPNYWYLEVKMIDYDTWALLLTSKEKLITSPQKRTLRCAWRGLGMLLSGRTLTHWAPDPGLASRLIPHTPNNPSNVIGNIQNC